MNSTNNISGHTIDLAREHARDLRTFPPMLQDSTPYDAATTRGHIVNYLHTNAAHIAATLDALADKCEQQATTIRRNAEDWADDDTRIREACKLVLPASEIEGDSCSVPSMADLCEIMAKKAVALADACERLREERSKFSHAWEKLCDFEMDNPPPPKEAGIDEYRCWRKELNAHKNVIHDLLEPPKAALRTADALRTDS